MPRYGVRCRAERLLSLAPVPDATVNENAAPTWIRALALWLEREEERPMAKGQRRSNKEPRKAKKAAPPKQNASAPSLKGKVIADSPKRPS